MARTIGEKYLYIYKLTIAIKNNEKIHAFYDKDKDDLEIKAVFDKKLISFMFMISGR